MALYKLSVCGGTFDLLHKGHKDFLKSVCWQSEKVLVGITSDVYVAKNSKATVQSYKEREEALLSFVKKEQLLKKITHAPIDTIYIPRKWESLPIEAIFVSQETKFGADAINKKREETGKRPLEVVVVPLRQAEDGDPISASGIREGTIDRNGMLYLRSEWFLQKRKLPENIRTMLQKPFDTLVTDLSSWLHRANINPKMLISVGDVITKALNQENVKHAISIIDFFVGRKERFYDIRDHGFLGDESLLTAENPAGFVTPSILKAVVEAFELAKKSKRVVIRVIGEEDLAVFPALLAAPLGWLILYGQPNEGVVAVSVSEKNKAHARALLSQFLPSSL